MADKSKKEWEEATKCGLKIGPSDGGPEADSLRFGKLNLIAVTWRKAFEAWFDGTMELMSRANKEGRPISREEAVQLFKKLRKGLERDQTPNASLSN